MAWVKAVPGSDDVFDEDMDDISLQNKEWKYNMEKRAKDGYRDGIDAGKEASLQTGFNLGYEEGASKMKAVGQLKGVLSALQCWCQSQSSRSSVLPSITELLRRVDQHEQDLVEAMRKAQEQPPPSVSEVVGDLEDMGIEQTEDKGGNGCCRKDGDSDGCRKDEEKDRCGQDKDMNRSSLTISSHSLFQTGESLEQLLQCCMELVNEMGLSEELKFHIQQLRCK